MGMAIGLFVIIIAATLYLMMQTSWYDTSATLEIQRTANLGMERLFRGFKADSDPAPRGLLDAKSFVIDSPGNIRFTSGIDSMERSFYLESNKLMYDPDTSAGSNEQSILDGVSALTFAASAQNPAKVVLINLTISRIVKGVDKTMSLSSVAVLRNG